MHANILVKADYDGADDKTGDACWYNVGECVWARCFNLSERTFSNSPLSYTDGGHTALPNPQQRKVYFAEFAFVYLLKFDTTPFE